MIALGVDTSTRDGSAAIVEEDRLLGEINLVGGGHHQGRLLRSVDLLLDLCALEIGRIEVFGVALGPGSFTGLRVGIATVKGLALARGVPAFGLSTLAALALRHGESGISVAPMVDAGRREIYGALYRVADQRPVPLSEERGEGPEAFVAGLPAEPLVFCGDGARLYAGVIEEVRPGGDRIEREPCFLGSTLGKWGARRLREGTRWALGDLRPNYIRLPDAQAGRKA